MTIVDWKKPTPLLWLLMLPLLAACTSNSLAADVNPPRDPVLQATSPPVSTISSQLIVIPTPTSYPDDQQISIGTSVEGRPLLAWQFGQGSVTLILVGGTHGGFEGNSVVLVEELAAYMRENPTSLLPGIRLIMIPSFNPDGVARGSGLAGRFNANNVDLNRNWGCGWEPTSFWRDEPTSPGGRPFSEPETVALRSYFLALEPSAVIFYHSAGGQIFIGDCNHDGSVSLWLGDLLAAASGYPNQAVFTAYPVSGTADDWLDERGIAAVTVELTDSSDPDFAQNLAGVMALQCQFALNGSADTSSQVRAQIEQQCAPFVPTS